jgi:hypothetical protein
LFESDFDVDFEDGEAVEDLRELFPLDEDFDRPDEPFSRFGAFAGSPYYENIIKMLIEIHKSGERRK